MTTTLFEHEPTQGIPWEARDLTALARLSLGVGDDVLRPVLRGGQVALQATQYVGVVRLRNRTIQVLPKIYRPSAGGDQRVGEATRNLLHLLGYAGQLTVREHGLAPLHREEKNWFEILTRLFAAHLKAEWQRGIVRRYESRDDELP